MTGLREKRVVSQAIIDEERDSGMSEEAVQQEYYCSFEGAMEGSYYGDLLGKVRSESRIGAKYYVPHFPVDTAWDLGLDDSTAIILTQTIGTVPYVIDFHEGKGGGLDVYARWFQQAGYLYGTHYWPHDGKVTEFSSGKTRLQHAWTLGFRQGLLGPVSIVPKVSVAEGINAARIFLAHAMWRDHPNVLRLLDLLVAYHREWDPELRVWSAKPVHDYSSHAADALRYRALAWQARQSSESPATALTAWSPFSHTPPPEMADTAFDVFKF
jgi:hypothetical protein